MKKKSLFCAVAIALLCACSSSNDEEVMSSDKQMVTLQFSPYDMAPMTRAAISDFATHLDVWISDGTTTIDFHQASDDAGFGSVSVALDKTKTYTLYAVAHRCTDAATLTDGVVAFPDNKITQSFFYSTTFSPATTTTLSCEMQRIVGQFRLETMDAVPDEVAKFTFSIPNTFTKYAVTGEGTEATDRTVTINVTSRRDDGTVAMSIYVIAANDETTLHDITVTALTSNDEVVEQRTFADVPIRNGYRTNYKGTFFITTDMSITFTADDWMEFDTVNY